MTKYTATGLMLIWLCSTVAPVAASDLRGDIMFASMTCNSSGQDTSVTLVRDHARLETFYQQIQSNLLGAKHPVPKMNYEKEMLLIVEMGQRNTGGYQLSFDSRKPILLEGSHATVTLTWNEPGPNTMTTQMLTSPCVIIRLPTADVTTFTVLDQEGKVRYKSPT